MDRPASAVDNLLSSRSSLARWGVRSWLLAGVLVAGSIVVWMLSQVSGFVVPLVIASVLGALFAPVVDRLHARGVPRPGGAFVVLLGLAGVVVGSIWLVVAGIVDQGPQIASQLAAGLDTLGAWLTSYGVDISSGTSITDRLGSTTEQALGGVGSLLSGAFSSAVSIGIGAAMGAFLVYYVLVDWAPLSRWVGGHLGLDAVTGTAVVGDAVVSVRRYFWSLTLSAVTTAVLIGGTAWALGVPLAFTIAVITLVTSYVPYLGAIVSGAFATLIALGSNGIGTALVMLAVILVVQNVVQTIVLARLASTALSLHPIVVLGSTIIGAALAGMLGAALSSPAVAVAVMVHRRLSGRPAEGGGSGASADGAGPAVAQT
ncbi:MAG TPA: AI-2E family transporter [Ornithinibacter sp.]|nr:AI-2E family transporter [Ornithinibacter sp.]